ncbi:MAG: hypothetical protein AYP45_00625 [Candidatus Brocadia carolinensis]|uniref:N-acetyltransferase domain-containing protein n=1 Tax=Candidatus Brocadia carolinensis TaxID=1004156 RepID=A0A1V4AXV3_9BACT|nr:MAG: hypothetical protein AYP45_00625 [Candidatus Brocadia caroliniensis]
MPMSKSRHHPPIRLRIAIPQDIDSILGLETSCFDRTEEMFNRRQIQRLISNPRATVVVAERKGVAMGWAAGVLRHHHQHQSGRLYAIAVHPNAQGKRIGYKLIDHILHSLTTHGAQRIFLEVHAENQKAMNLYHKLGFIVQGHLADYYGAGHHGIRMMCPGTSTPHPQKLNRTKA